MDYHKSDEHVEFYIDIKLFNAPCSVVNIDYRDLMGRDIHAIKVEKRYMTKDKTLAEYPVRFTNYFTFYSLVARNISSSRLKLWLR